MKRDSVVIYRNLYEALQDVSEKAYKRIMNAILKYSMDGEETILTGVEKAVFQMAKTQIDANNKKFENGKRGAEFGALGGRPKNEINPTETPRKPQENPTETPNKPLNEKCEMRNEKCNLKESKNESKYIFKNNTPCARDSKNLPTYSEVMDYMGVDENVKAKLWEFIKHCQLNGKMLTNDKLEAICVDLDKQTNNYLDQIKILDDAIRGGYFDIKRSG